jgi:hypothetical protein
MKMQRKIKSVFKLNKKEKEIQNQGVIDLTQ